MPNINLFVLMHNRSPYSNEEYKTWEKKTMRTINSRGSIKGFKLNNL